MDDNNKVSSKQKNESNQNDVESPSHNPDTKDEFPGII